MRSATADTLTLITTRLFDYAGMFPPAGRSFEDALRESASFPTTLKRPWMLGSDIVLDVEHAEKLLTLNLRSFGITRNLSLCLLATDTPQRCLDIATKLLSKRREDGLSVTISSLEAKASMEGLPTIIEHLLPFTQRHSALLALEPDLSTPSWRSALDTTIAAIQGRGIALKCRCTGPTGIGPERLARAIVCACDNKLGLKVTGGLHHPIVEPARYNNRFGFLNLATAVALRRARGEQLSEATITSLLVNQEYTALTVGETLGYSDVSASYEEVSQAVKSASFAIGSCSLHEPDADISRLAQSPSN